MDMPAVVIAAASTWKNLRRFARVSQVQNADLKQGMGKRVPVRTKAKLRAATAEHMTMLEQNPERVMRDFQDKRVQYAV